MPSTAEKYLRPEVIRQVGRLDLRAKFIVEGFIAGLHQSPYHGFSVEFSEHRKYVPGDDLKDIDWNVLAKTDKYYIKKFEAETNVTGYLVMDLSRSMGYTYRQKLTKFEYSICLAAALAYLMIHQQDPVGLMTFDESLRSSLPARSRRTQLGNILAVLSKSRPRGPTDVELSLETKRLLAHGSRDIERLPVGIENRYLERVRPVRLFPGHLDNAADREGRGSGPGVSPAYSQRMEHIALYLGEVSEQQSQFHEARAGVSDWSEGIRVVVAGASCKARRPTLLGGVK